MLRCVLKIEQQERDLRGTAMGQDPRAYLETEARIIIENDTHVAIALRLEKAAIARNLLFLAALAELMPALKTMIEVSE
jgi:hypothetical protein